MYACTNFSVSLLTYGHGLHSCFKSQRRYTHAFYLCSRPGVRLSASYTSGNTEVQLAKHLMTDVLILEQPLLRVLILANPQAFYDHSHLQKGRKKQLLKTLGQFPYTVFTATLGIQMQQSSSIISYAQYGPNF